MADSNNEVESQHHSRKKKKRLRVEMSALNDTPDRIAPIVGYFSSGYNPSDSIDPPQIRVFRNKNHRSTRLDLVVKPTESSVEFVGKSYEGETALHQPCHYALGILDKDSQTLKVVPIAANKILRLEPREMKSSEGLEGAEKTARKLSDATSVFGTKKQRKHDKRMQLLIQQTKDPSAREHLQDEMLDADMNNEALEDTKATVGPNIPPHDLSAKTPEKAYLLDEIILKGEREYLFDILNLLDSGIGANATLWEENYYPSFVANRIHKLKEIRQAEEERNNYAIILSYITHLVNFWKLAGSRHAKADIYGDAMYKYKIPRVVYQKFVNLFLDPASKVLPTDKKELILGYILVLTLFADKFKSKATDIAKDLGMSTADLKPYFKQLGCKLQNFGLNNYLWTLPVPLKSEVVKVKRRPKK